ncbi:MAG: ribosome assembly RNA-binding protein YhbY [Clostridiaceae bacterium]|jgi:RNA-binding protein|nr:ribosome assembly RNA-binding protein YhbY [Clostridiaceae bacterium]
MLTGKQRSYLRSIANTVPTIFQVGKDGISNNMIKQVNDALEAREVVKGNVLKNSGIEAREACEELAETLNAEIVQIIGNRFVLYRESAENKVIELP